MNELSYRGTLMGVTSRMLGAIRGDSLVAFTFGVADTKLLVY